MALQDLTPQLRTRLSRMERAVGWFVVLATALLVFGFVYYIYKTAERKGWFLTKAPYDTYTDRATGLKPGDPVMLMGLEVGQITHIEPMSPEFPYNIYVELEIKDPYYGYLWTVGSRAKIDTADFLGKRVLEVTKGTNGYPIYVFNPLRELTLAQASALPEPEKWKLAEDIYDSSGLDLIIAAFTPLTRTNLTRISALGRTQIRALDTSEKRKFMTAVWRDREGCYARFTKANMKTNLYWLPSDESPAVTERLEKLVSQIEKALPNILALTNPIAAVLSNSVNLTSNLNALASDARPVAANLTYISAQLREPGALGEWMLGTNAHGQLNATLENANAVITHTDTNLTSLADSLSRSLDSLAGITSNLNAQVESNTNILSEISAAVIHADGLVQGLKHHWLLRSAFRDQTNQPLSTPRLSSPKLTEP